MKIIKRAVPLLLACCLIILTLTGCGGNESPAAFQIGFTSLYLNNDAIAAYGETLTAAMPELTIEGEAPMFTPIVMGEVENDPNSGVINDPMMGIAGMMQSTAMVASGELDVIISDMDNAARNAQGGMFMPLSEVFTADELAALEGKLLSFDILSTDGEEALPTGEKTPLCGISLTGNADMQTIFGNQEVGVFIVANTAHPEMAKAVAQTLI